VQNGASVSGDTGFVLNTDNAINNLGAVQGTSQFGINSAGNVSVVNSGSITGTGAGINAGGTVGVTNNVGGTIQGTFINGISAAIVTGTNAGTISGGPAGSGINATTVTITNSGSISGHENGIIAAGAADVTNNGGTIGSARSGTSGISAGTDATVVNSGTISGPIGIKAGQSANVTNSGTISSIGLGQFGISAGTNAIVVNSGSITGTVAAINAGGTASNIFNAGTITGNSGTAVQFAGGNNILTLGPGSIINGLVTGGSANIFQLGGVGSDTFNLGLIGAAQQYRNFSTFNKIDTSTWTLTGTFGQANPWTVQGGTLLVNGDLSTASGLTVNTGATLGGIGTLPSTVIAGGGTFAPGSGTPGTSLTTGNLTFASGATYQVQLDATGQASKANVNGTATLGGANVQAVQHSAGCHQGSRFFLMGAAS
jgi:hypothetical protein